MQPSFCRKLELCTGFEPVILVLQTNALTNLANRACRRSFLSLPLEFWLKLPFRVGCGRRNRTSSLGYGPNVLPLHHHRYIHNGAHSLNRTDDLRITSASFYQLNYASILKIGFDLGMRPHPISVYRLFTHLSITAMCPFGLVRGAYIGVKH